MHHRFLSNAYLTADEEPSHILRTHALPDHVEHEDEVGWADGTDPDRRRL